MPTKTCFVVMGFGKKTDFETGRVLDLDKSYKYMIKPAVEAAGFQCIRADEIVHSGLIDVPMYEQLLRADVVVADLSTSNKNAYYELGIRHALRPYTTVVICEDGIKTFPFDVNHVAIRQYHHLGEDVGFEEVMRFRDLLTKAINEIMTKDPRDKDSPVYTFINGLNPPAVAEIKAAVDAAANHGQNGPGNSDTNSGKPAVQDGVDGNTETHSVLMQLIDKAQAKGDWITAKTLLAQVRHMKLGGGGNNDSGMQLQEDPYILQRLALATYKSKLPSEKDALIEAHHLLNLLNPDNSNDTETLGLWGAVHKRLWDLTRDLDYLDRAIRAYERGFYIRNDYYNGINFAFLLNVRAAHSRDTGEAIADFVEARRVRKEVRSICEGWLENNPMPDKEKAHAEAMKEYLSSYYWVKATLGEAYLGLGDAARAQETLEEAYASAPESWMPDATKDQVGKLTPLLQSSPLRFIREDAPTATIP